ncbi:Sim4 and Mal2 associated protein 2 [Schizosaccharomyces cryophilus OY26]|uniref:Sim4 and Mal2 associated protein 2 n=1 Tax=Schizosaccharomyces cryophilus (strain OY26 / ATCC MYA-4695 / CBS 11777 / NBRC 106824 / NRRL Y48691) TaxID=653667 RepID=S9XD66_SCHCR|nr:Sim4 and Mal2 associated protein 2 [Schizosaccharomyces cryophilus OY26]EPY51771.1 Sim4 and Mal2 associated protein 2 [Schizosaccharomyces cryophilus OY26]
MTSRRFSQISQEDNSSSEEEIPIEENVGQAKLHSSSINKKIRNTENTPTEEKSGLNPLTWEKKELLERRNQLYSQIYLLEQDIVRFQKQTLDPNLQKQEHQMLKELVGLFFETSPASEDRQSTKNDSNDVFIPSAAPNINRPVRVSFSGLRILTHQSTDVSDVHCMHEFKGLSDFFPFLDFHMYIHIRTTDYAILEMFSTVASFARNELQSVLEKSANARDVVTALRAISMFGYYHAIRSDDWTYFLSKFDGLARVDLTTSELHVQSKLYKVSLQHNICFDEFGFAKAAYNILFRPKKIPQKSEESISLLTKKINHRFHELISLFGFRKGSEILLEILFKPANG